MTTLSWATPSSPTTYLSSALANLADGSFTAVVSSATVSNQTGLNQYLNLELDLGSLSPGAGAFCDVWLYGSLDGGVSFASDSDATQNNAILVAFALGTTASTSQRLLVSNVSIPPLAFKLAIRNKSGVALAPVNTLRYTTHNEQGV